MIARWQLLLAELKRRRVVRVALIYMAGAFAALQAADVLVPALHLPGWLVTAVAVLLIAGFPLVLALAWAFDLTSDGVRRTAPSAADVPVAGSVTGSVAPVWVGRRTIAAVAMLLIFGGGFGAGVFLRPQAGVAHAIGPVTVAVMPFQNLSGDASTEPFVLGLHDDLLTQLSQLGALRVISRTSVMEYRGSPKNVRVIAAELGAGAVLEGGVQRSGDRIRLNVQLIDARSDAHLWAESYERALTAENVFAIQADIARSIARALQAELAPAEQLALSSAPTTDLAALEAYHSGRDAFNQGGDRRRRVAPRMFERAVELDPSFAEAWAGLAKARSWLVRENAVRDTAPALEALERARALAPGTVATQLAAAYFEYYARADLHRAQEAFRAAHAAAPGNADAVVGFALVQRRLGRMSEAVAQLSEAARLDPRNASHYRELAWTLALAGDPHAALPLSERALRLGPDIDSGNMAHFGLLLWELGDTLAAARFAAASVLADHPVHRATWQAQLAVMRRDPAAALKALTAASADTTRSFSFSSYGDYFAAGMPQLMKLAWLAGDAQRLHDWTQRALIVADSAAAQDSSAADRWGRPAEIALLRALAHAFRGDTARALAAAAVAQPYAAVDDVIIAATVRDHLVIVDILTGRHERALDGIEHLVSSPSLLKPARLRLDPIYDPLRGNPRFRVLLARAEAGAQP
jgi:TolB-like protein